MEGLSHGASRHGPEGFCLRLGLRRTGEMSGDQVVGEPDLPRV